AAELQSLSTWLVKLGSRRMTSASCSALVSGSSSIWLTRMATWGNSGRRSTFATISCNDTFDMPRVTRSTSQYSFIVKVFCKKTFDREGRHALKRFANRCGAVYNPFRPAYDMEKGKCPMRPAG